MTPAPKRRWLPVVVAATSIAFISFIAYVSWSIHHAVTEVVPNCYAVEWVASMVIDYLATHDEEWPSGWDDLRESYVNVAKKVSHPREPDYPWPFDELRNRVEVDWSVNPRTLADTPADHGKPPFRVIWLRDGSQSHWASSEPNQLILDFLRKSRPTAEDR
jgi:hypothetical protein